MIPYLLGSDMLVRSGKALEDKSPFLLVMYYSGVDTLAHRYGPYSEEVTFELNSIERSLKTFVGSLSEKTKKETLMVLTADHGVAETPKTYFLKDFSDVMAQLALPPVGDSRAAFLYLKRRNFESFSEAFDVDIHGFKLFPSDELISRQAFGQTSNLERLKESVGDFTVLASGQSSLQYPFYEDDRMHPQLGGHGGMTPEEMVVPFLSVRLSRF